ncbi:MAG: cytochrome P450 [Pseudomonadales bacterium]
MHYSIDPKNPALYQDPYPIYDEMRKLGASFYWEEYAHWCFPGFNEVNQLLRDRRFGNQLEGRSGDSALDRFEQNSLLELEPPAHTRLRRLVNRAFVSRQVEKQRVRIEKLANELIDKFESDGHVNLLTAYAEIIPVVVICELLGVSTDMADQLLLWSHKMVAIYEHGRDEKVEVEANEATSEFEKFIELQIEGKRRQPADDLLSELILVEEAGDKLSLAELVATCILLLNAGHEATVHGIGNGVKNILSNKIDRGHWFSSPDNIKALVEESLRFDPPLHMFNRFVLEDLEYGGREFKRGDVIGLMLGSANRDPAKFSDPNSFDPQRGGIGHVSFGAGIHFCVGAPLARLELEIALPVLFKRLPHIRLKGEPDFANRYHFHGLEKLELEWG